MKKIRSFVSYILTLIMIMNCILPAFAGVEEIRLDENQVATASIVGNALLSTPYENQHVAPDDVSWSINDDGILVENWKDIEEITDPADWYVYIQLKNYDQNGNQIGGGRQRISLAEVRDQYKPEESGQMVHKDSLGRNASFNNYNYRVGIRVCYAYEPDGSQSIEEEWYSEEYRADCPRRGQVLSGVEANEVSFSGEILTFSGVDPEDIAVVGYFADLPEYGHGIYRVTSAKDGQGKYTINFSSLGIMDEVTETGRFTVNITTCANPDKAMSSEEVSVFFVYREGIWQQEEIIYASGLTVSLTEDGKKVHLEWENNTAYQETDWVYINYYSTDLGSGDGLFPGKNAFKVNGSRVSYDVINPLGLCDGAQGIYLHVAFLESTENMTSVSRNEENGVSYIPEASIQIAQTTGNASISEEGILTFDRVDDAVGYYVFLYGRTKGDGSGAGQYLSQAYVAQPGEGNPSKCMIENMDSNMEYCVEIRAIANQKENLNSELYISNWLTAVESSIITEENGVKHIVPSNIECSFNAEGLPVVMWDNISIENPEDWTVYATWIGRGEDGSTLITDSWVPSLDKMLNRVEILGPMIRLMRFASLPLYNHDAYAVDFKLIYVYWPEEISEEEKTVDFSWYTSENEFVCPREGEVLSSIDPGMTEITGEVFTYTGVADMTEALYGYFFSVEATDSKTGGCRFVSLGTAGEDNRFHINLSDMGVNPEAHTGEILSVTVVADANPSKGMSGDSVVTEWCYEDGTWKRVVQKEETYFKPGNTWIPEGLDIAEVYSIQKCGTAVPSGATYLGIIDTKGIVKAYQREMKVGTYQRYMLYISVPENYAIRLNQDSASMFEGFTSLRGLNAALLSGKVQNAKRMFYGCQSLHYLSFMMGTDSDTETDDMFTGCKFNAMYVGENFHALNALPSDLKYYNGYSQEGKDGYTNETIPDKEEVYVTDPEKYYFVKYYEKESPEQWTAQLAWLASEDDAYLDDSDVTDEVYSIYKEPETGVYYYTYQEIPYDADGSVLAWKSLEITGDVYTKDDIILDDIADQVLTDYRSTIEPSLYGKLHLKQDMSVNLSPYAFDIIYENNSQIGTASVIIYDLCTEDEILRKNFDIVESASEFCTVYLNTNGYGEGTTDTFARVAKGNPFDELESGEIDYPRADGVIFSGWYKEKECIHPWSYGQTVDHDITLYARWVDESVRWIRQEDGRYKYLNKLGEYVTDEWIMHGTFYSYLDSDGYMVTDQLIEVDGRKFYVDARGYRVFGTWVNVPVEESPTGYKKMYFRSSTGRAYEDCTATIDGKRYHFEENGYVCCGFMDEIYSSVDNPFDARYYADDNGMLQTGWFDGTEYRREGEYPKLKTLRFYFKKYGKVSSMESCKIGGVKYWFDENGVVIKVYDGDYTVTFQMNGHGKKIDPLEQVRSGSTILAPNDPTEDGYKFEGWFKTASCTLDACWNFDVDKVEDDLILYAKWTPVAELYTVTFDLNGHGKGETASQHISAGMTVPEPSAPTDRWYEFSGWYKEKDCINKWNFTEDTVTSSDIELFAGWYKQGKWYQESGEWLYYEDGVLQKNRWVKSYPPEESWSEEEFWYYLGSNGARHSAGVWKIQYKYYLFDDDRRMVSGLVIGTTVDRKDPRGFIYDEELTNQYTVCYSKYKSLPYEDSRIIMFFSDSQEDGAMKIGEQMITLDGETETLYFDESGCAIEGVVDNCIYQNGILQRAGDTLVRLVELRVSDKSFDAGYYLVGSEGDILQNTVIKDIDDIYWTVKSHHEIYRLVDKVYAEYAAVALLKTSVEDIAAGKAYFEKSFVRYKITAEDTGYGYQRINWCKDDSYCLIQWINDDGTVLQQGLVKKGIMPEYTEPVPEMDPVGEYEFVFKGWNPEVSAVTQQQIYKATYSKKKRRFSITWKNYDGSLLEQDVDVVYNSIPSYDGRTPSRPADGTFKYIFEGWTPELVQVTANAVYIAQYRAVPDTEGDSIKEFVERLYLVCLGRYPDIGGFKNWVEKLKNHEQSGTEVAYSFLFSDEFKAKNYCNTCYVKHLYLAMMGREADEAGLKDWVEQLNNLTKREVVFNGFAGSNEFAQLCQSYGITKGDPIPVPEKGTKRAGQCKGCGAADEIETFVRRLYIECLDREADQAGLASWCKQLREETLTGTGAAASFLFSDEFKKKSYCNNCFVEHLYRAMMGRDADAEGKASWIKNLTEGMKREEVYNGFTTSKEFTDLCKTYGIVKGDPIEVPPVGTKRNGNCAGCGAEDEVEAFVKRLYIECLDREADQAGLASWSKQLREETIGGVVTAHGFIFSDEFIKHNYNNADYVEHLYRALMGRASDPSGKASWVRQLENGVSRETVFGGFGGSDEFKAICRKYGIMN